MQRRAMGMEGIFLWGECFPGMVLGGTDPQPEGLLDRGFYRAGETLSKEPGWFVRGSRALLVMCQHGGGPAGHEAGPLPSPRWALAPDGSELGSGIPPSRGCFGENRGHNALPKT